jgi:hypothetical protein
MVFTIQLHSIDAGVRLEGSIFSFLATEAVAGAVSVLVAVQHKIVTEPLSASLTSARCPVLVGRLRPSTLGRTMPASS